MINMISALSTWQAITLALTGLLGQSVATTSIAIQNQPPPATQPAQTQPQTQTQPQSQPADEPTDEPEVEYETKQNNNPENIPDAPLDPDIIPVDDPELDKLLDQLEHSADNLRNFTARLTYRKFDSLLNGKETRSGNIIYVSEPVKDLPGTFIRKFAVLFDVQVIRQRRSERTKHYIFDGRWLAEIDGRNKLFHAREIVPPGRVLDPLKLGEGPFPLPLGQKKSEVLKRFTVDWADMPPTGLLSTLENVVGIVLVPRYDSAEAAEFRRVEVYYDKKTLLPVGVDAIPTNGDRKTVLLKNIARNITLDPDTLAKININPPNDESWTVTIDPWQGE